MKPIRVRRAATQYCAGLLMVVFGSTYPGKADNLAGQKAALAAIIDTADRICSVVQDRGEASSSEVQGEVRAQLNGLASRLADVGVGGSGNINTGRYAGVLRSELAATLKNNADCKLEVLRSLRAMIVPGSNSEPPPSSPGRTSLPADQRPGSTAMVTPPPSGPAEQACADEGVLRVCAISVAARSGGKGTVTVVLRMRNTGREPVGVALIGPAPNAIASDGTLLELDRQAIGGIGACMMIEAQAAERCLDPTTGYLPAGRYLRIAPNGLANSSFRFNGAPAAEANILAFQATFAVRALAGSQGQQDEPPNSFTVGLGDLPVSKAR